MAYAAAFGFQKSFGLCVRGVFYGSILLPIYCISWDGGETSAIETFKEHGWEGFIRKSGLKTSGSMLFQEANE